MREILFRGKRTDNGEWVEGYILMGRPYSCNNDEVNIVPPTNPMFFPQYRLDTYYTVDPETVGQFTGVVDKNGVKIFEGDIVDVSDCNWYWCGPATYDSPIVKVEWSQAVSGFDPFANYDCDCDIYYKPKDVKVIGNVHDNPELLEVREDD